MRGPVAFPTGPDCSTQRSNFASLRRSADPTLAARYRFA